MSFQFRRRGDVREQSPQQEPFFQNTTGQQPFVDTTVYPQMGQPQEYDPRFNNGFGQQNQPHPPQQLQNMQPGTTQQPAQPYFQANNGNFYGQPQSQGNMQQHPQQPLLNPSMGQPYGMAQPQMGSQQQYPGVVNPQDYINPIQASQLSNQRNNFQSYSQTDQRAHAQGVQQAPSAQYTTPEDVRSLSFWQETNANSGFEDPDESETNSPVRLLVAVAGVALIAGLSWFAYKWAKSPTSDTPPLIHAEPGPHKVSPEHRGGLNIPYQDKLIYDRIGDNNTEEPAERLLPPPEKPSMVNSQTQQPVDQSQQNASQQPMYSEEPIMQQNAMPGLPDRVPQSQPGRMHPEQQSQNQQRTPEVATQPQAQPQLGNIQQQSQQQVIQEAAETKADQPEVITKTKSTPTLKGSYFVQMATVKSEVAALREWKRVQAKYNLKGMKSQIKESETTDGEVVYRLLMGPFDEKVKALKYAVKIDGTKVVHVTE